MHDDKADALQPGEGQEQLLDDDELDGVTGGAVNAPLANGSLPGTTPNTQLDGLTRYE